MATEIIPATARTAILPSQPSGLPVLVERAGGAAPFAWEEFFFAESNQINLAMNLRWAVCEA